MSRMELEDFGAVKLQDPFFDTLKADYPGFEAWFNKKASQGDSAYVFRQESGDVEGFLYLKYEDGVVGDVTPPLPAAKRLKIGTFKIDGHGTKLGERCLKKIFDQALAGTVEEIYVTVFAKHAGLTKLFDKYGFVLVAKKVSANGDEELVMLRNMKTVSGDSLKDYPLIKTRGRNKYLLAIYPKWHTQLLPDSILNNESYDVVQDLSHTNSIHKVYISFMGVEVLNPGDILVMYRTLPPGDTGTAEYRSVATSLCVVEDVKTAKSFATEAEFIRYCGPHSVFTDAELKGFYADKARTRVVKFSYNAAMTKRLIRKILADEVGIDRNARWSFLRLTDDQFTNIVLLGGVNENIIVD